MGSITTHMQSTATSPASNTSSNSKIRKPKRMNTFLSRKSSMDNHSIVIDPDFIGFAQNPSGDLKPDDFSKQTLDLIAIQLRDGEESTPTNPETGFFDGATHSQSMRESTKQNDRTASHKPTATVETSLPEIPQPRDSIADQLLPRILNNNQTLSEDNNHSAIREVADNSTEAQGIFFGFHLFCRLFYVFNSFPFLALPKIAVQKPVLYPFSSFISFGTSFCGLK